jgi:hypothetical protein
VVVTYPASSPTYCSSFLYLLDTASDEYGTERSSTRTLANK